MKINWLSENKYDVLVKIVLFLLNPVLGLFASLVRIRTRSSFIVLFLVLITFGFSMTFSDVRDDEDNFDGIFYRQAFEEMVYDSWADFGKTIVDYVTLEGDTDIYCYLLSFFVSRYSSNYHVLFLFVTAIFALISLATLKFFVAEKNYKLSFFCLALLFVFTINQVVKLSAFRYFTALALVVYAIFQIFVNKNRKYWFLCFIAPLIHASMFLIFLLLPLYYWAKKSMKTVLLVGILLMLLSLMFDPADSIAYILSGASSDAIVHYESYVDADYIFKINKAGSGFIWVRRLLELTSILLIDVVLVFFLKNYSRINGTNCVKLFNFFVAATIFVNATILIPSVGSRFMLMLFPMIAYIALVCFDESKYHWAFVLFSSFYLFCFFVPIVVYSIPNFIFYFRIWDYSFWYSSPIYLAVKYLVL